MNTNHTSAPWYWHTDSRGQVSIRTPDRGNLIVADFCRKGMQGAAPRFARWTNMETGATRERLGGILCDFDENHPDARLLVAAPKLLEALSAFMARFDGAALCEDDLPDHKYASAARLAYEVIAEIKGESK